MMKDDRVVVEIIFDLSIAFLLKEKIPHLKSFLMLDMEKAFSNGSLTTLAKSRFDTTKSFRVKPAAHKEREK